MLGIKPGRFYKLYINRDNPHNGLIHVLGVVAINRAHPVAVVAEWLNRRQLWHVHTMGLSLLDSYARHGWIADAGITEHNVQWGIAQVGEESEPPGSVLFWPDEAAGNN